ncbi:corticotropin-releasing factor-binding protein [Atheta coriaria]|uniref:corticotropin-releasing factor-binding protein n=1 Tax=Dalotia coriaria TaxID=877792 RepID=UPI0031F39E9E
MNESDSALAGVLRDRQGGASVYLKLVRRRRRPHKHPSVGTLSHTPHITLQRRPATASDRRVSPEVQQPPTDAEMYLCSVATFFCCWAIVLVKTHPHILPSLHAGDQHVKTTSGTRSKNFAELLRTKRSGDHVIADCIHMSSEEGQYYYKAHSQQEGNTCGVYFFTDPDKRIELHFNYLDVECDNGGLVSFVDGWELNGQFFPSPEDHPKPMSQRFSEFCGERKIKQSFVSAQNVALVQYRMPSQTSSFSLTVRFVKNTTPCNVLLQDVEDVYTLRNYGRRSNCSFSALFPAAVRVLSVNVGVTSRDGRSVELETGTLHKCQKRGLDDYAQIGGSSGLDNAGLMLADSVCGMDSKPGKITELIGCGTTTIRLVSSGGFDNSVTIAMRQLTEQDFSGYISVMCPLEGLKK